MLLRTIVFLSIFVYKKISCEDCKVGQLASFTNFTDEKFPSLARIIDLKVDKFLCNALIISKNQLLTSRSCLEGKKELGEIVIVLREYNQKETTNLTVAELFFHPSWSPDSNNIEANSVIIITKSKIPFNFFVFSTCFREFLLDQKQKIHLNLNENACETTDEFKNHKFFEISFPKSRSGLLYTKFREKWFSFGFYMEDVIEAKVCDTKTFKSFNDLLKLFICDNPSDTTATTRASFCSGEVIFEDNFDTLDPSKWKHEYTLRGGGNWEFQWYVPDSENSFIKDGILHIKPTFTDDKFGKKFVTTKTASIPIVNCTDPENYGCSRSSKYGTINPIRSASISTVNSLAFKYGTVEIRAKIAAGDWLASTISLLPKDPVFYGMWPHSGEIDLLESRGNRNYTTNDGNIGVERIGTSFHFGADWAISHGEKTNSNGYHKDFHVYKLIWTPTEIKSFVDEEIVHHIKFTDVGLWRQFTLGLPEKNPWKNGNSNSPFDKEFYISISLKCGGVSFFPDDATNYPFEKPWENNGEHAATAFWKKKDEWGQTWIENEKDFQIDYVKVTAL